MVVTRVVTSVMTIVNVRSQLNSLWIEYEYQDTLQDDHYRINLTSLPDEIQRTWKHEEAEFLIAMTINLSTTTETRQIQSQSPVFFIQNASVV
eukprot:318103_1